MFHDEPDCPTENTPDAQAPKKLFKGVLQYRFDCEPDEQGNTLHVEVRSLRRGHLRLVEQSFPPPTVATSQVDDYD